MEASRPTEAEGALPAWTLTSRGRTGAGALMPWIRWVLPLRALEQLLLSMCRHRALERPHMSCLAASDAASC